MTGPIARDDAATLERHCRDLAQQRPDLLRLYRILGDYALALAAARGELETGRIETLRALLVDASFRDA